MSALTTSATAGGDSVLSIDLSQLMAPLHDISETLALERTSCGLPKAKSKEEADIKKNAVGNTSIAGKSRIFLKCGFTSQHDGTQEWKYCYFDRNSTLSDTLEYIQSTESLSSVIFGAGKSSSNQRLVVEVEGVSWQKWNFNVLGNEQLHSLFYDYEPIVVKAVTESDFLCRMSAIQLAIEEGQKREAVQALQAERVAATAAALAVKYEKGDLVQYTKGGILRARGLDSSPESAAEAEAYITGGTIVQSTLAKIVGVHHDDYPNIYYTIQPIKLTCTAETADGNLMDIVADKTHREVQTDPLHLDLILTLSSNTPQADTSSKGLNIKVEHDGKTYNVADISPVITLASLREYVAHATYNLVPMNQRRLLREGSGSGRGEEEKGEESTGTDALYVYDIIFKGKALKNESKNLKHHKIIGGAKLSLVASGR